jgi:hypothetical protein
LPAFAAAFPASTGILTLSKNVILRHLLLFISGSLKIVYDLLLYRSFQAIRAPEESE